MAIDVAGAAQQTGTGSRRRAPGPTRNCFLDYQRDFPRLVVRMQNEYGNIVRYRIGPMLVHQVTHPELIRQVLTGTDSRYYNRGLFYEGFKAYFGEGLLTTDGEKWRRHRDVSRPLFHPRRIEDMTPAITDAAVTMVERLRAHADKGEQFDLVPEAMWYTIEVLGRCLFGTALGDAVARVGPAVQVGLPLILQRINPVNQAIPTWVPTRHNLKLRRTLGVLEEFLGEVIEEHRRHPREDLVTGYLEATDAKEITAREVRDGLMTTFLAGHETTGTSLAWTLYKLATTPAIRRTLEAELDSVLGGRPATLEDLPKLNYTRMVVEESLRVYPPIWLYPRGATKDLELGGYHIPAGSSLFISPYAVHRNPEIWDNPEAFDPERFLPERVAERDKHAYLPFGFGQRQCIGKHIALLQLQVAVATIAQEMHLSLVPGGPVTYHAKVSLRPRQQPTHNLMVTAQRRTK